MQYSLSRRHLTNLQARDARFKGSDSPATMSYLTWDTISIRLIDSIVDYDLQAITGWRQIGPTYSTTLSRLIKIKRRKKKHKIINSRALTISEAILKVMEK